MYGGYTIVVLHRQWFGIVQASLVRQSIRWRVAACLGKRVLLISKSWLSSISLLVVVSRVRVAFVGCMRACVVFAPKDSEYDEGVYLASGAISRCRKEGKRSLLRLKKDIRIGS